MKTVLSTKLWILVMGLLMLLVLSPGVVKAQGSDGTIIVNACTDQNADGDCEDDVDAAAPAEVKACLNDDSNCQLLPAIFDNLPAGSHTPFLRFTGASQGFYPTSPRLPIDLAPGQEVDVTLGAVYPFHPKGIAVHEQLNKVYVAFQGPTIGHEKPYPFVAVIDGKTDEVLLTIPGGAEGLVPFGPRTPNAAGIGRSPWGVAVSANGQFVYVGSFEDGLISIIDPFFDTVLTNYSAGTAFKPISPAVNPVSGLVNYPDFEGGRVLILSNDPANPQAAAPSIINPPLAFSPFEMVTASTLDGYNFVTLRDAISPNPFKFVGFDSGHPFDLTFHDIVLPDGNTGPPHAIGLWPVEEPGEARLFITYADDPRATGETFPNPNKLLVYGFPETEPQNVQLRQAAVDLGDYAEVGLIFNPATNHMVGTYAGFAYRDEVGHIAACDNPSRGGNYAVNFDGEVLAGEAPGVWRFPRIVIGNPPLISHDLQWRNPFELAVNPNNDKVYVTDRCWNEFPDGGQPGGGAVLIFNDSDDGPQNPQLTVTKLDTPDPIRPGEELTYTIRVDNTGDVDLNATIVDTLPAGVTPTGPMTWDDVFIPVGGFWEQSLTVTVDSDFTGTLLTNRVDVTTTQGATGSATTETSVLIVNPGLIVTKSDTPDPVQAGQVLTYTIRVENTGDVDLNATVVDALPPGVTPHGSTTWDNVLIPIGGFWEQLLAVTTDPGFLGTVITNHVTVTTTQGITGSAVEETSVLNPRLTVTKTDSPDPVLAGEELVYTIRVDNVGNVDLNATIVDILPPGVMVSDPTIWTDIFIPVGEFWEQMLPVNVDVNAAGILTNTVEVTTTEGATGTVEVTTEVIPRGKIIVSACPDLDADGSCGPGEPLPPGVQGCLAGEISGDLGCQGVSAVFTGLDPDDSFTPSLRFTGDSQGRYSTTRREAISVVHGEEVEVILGAVYPVHPKDVAVHDALNKVYVAFQGPKINDDSPYPFVAVIDGTTDEVLYTIPGGSDGIGRGPWGVAVSGAGQDVYVGSFFDERVSVIDPVDDTVIANVSPGGSFRPTVAAVNPTTGWIHFPDYQGGRMIALDGLAIVKAERIDIAPMSFSPFEMVVADFGSEGYSFVTMRDAIQPHRFKFATLNNSSLELTHSDLALPGDGTGTPHAIGLWQPPGAPEGRLFITYADDPRSTGETFPNPNKLAVFGFPTVNPKDVLQRSIDIDLGAYAEVGLIFDPVTNQMLGTFGGFAYTDAAGDEAACANPRRGGTYAVDFDGNVSSGFAPNVVVGNPPLMGSGLDWRNPFELTVNANNGKVYVTDRCWNDFSQGGQAGGGAVLIYDRSGNGAVTTGAATSSLSPMHSGSPLGDVTGDGRVTIHDLAFIARHYGTDDPAADVNGDGIVDISDLVIVTSNYER